MKHRARPAAPLLGAAVKGRTVVLLCGTGAAGRAVGGADREGAAAWRRRHAALAEGSARLGQALERGPSTPTATRWLGAAATPLWRRAVHAEYTGARQLARLRALRTMLVARPCISAYPPVLAGRAEAGRKGWLAARGRGGAELRPRKVGMERCTAAVQQSWLARKHTLLHSPRKVANSRPQFLLTSTLQP